MPLTLAAPTSTVLRDVSWASYRQLRADAGTGTRMTFDHGTLEIMPPISWDRGNSTGLIARLVETFMRSRSIGFTRADVVTLALEDVLRGCEGDQMYYVQATPPPPGAGELDLTIHNAPDLVIEVDLSSRSVDKEPLYAAFGVVELLRLDGDQLRLRRVNGAGDGFEGAEASGLLPGLDVGLMAEHVVLRALLAQQAIDERWAAAING